MSAGAGPEHPTPDLQEERPVFGLPDALMAWEGKIPAAVVMSYKASGINRKTRLENNSKHRKKPVSKNNPHWRYLAQSFPELKELPYDREQFFDLISGEARFTNFWRGVATPIVPERGKRPFIREPLSIDGQLLARYDKDWNALELDEAALTAACPAWPGLRAQIITWLMRENADQSIDMDALPLGLFMLWPRLQHDFQHWDTLDEQRRTDAAHAAFALSSAARSGWFIERALELCPALAAQFDWIVRHRDWTPPPVADTDTQASGQEWMALIERLDELAHELNAQPTQEAVSELAALVAALEQHSAHLPHRQAEITQQLDEQVQALRQRLHQSAAQDGFAWLDTVLLQKIDARWQARRDASNAPESLAALRDHITAALSHLDELIPACARLYQQVGTAAHEVACLEQTLESADGFLHKARIQPQLEAARQTRIDTEKAQHAKQTELIEAVLPPGDKLALLFDPPPEPDGPPSSDPPTTQDTEDPGETGAAPELDQPPPPPEEMAADTGTDIRMTPLTVDDRAPPAPSPAPETIAAPPPQDTEERFYNRRGGEICKPLWQCLERGEPGLAWHAAQWIAQVHPDVPLPPPALLAAVAYAQELLESDSALAIELADQFERFAHLEFEIDAPPPWHSALNLLLVAATLRPMVLAPASGAVQVAEYLHLDGDYQALNDMHRQLRALSAQLAGFRIDANAIKRARGDAGIHEELQALRKETEQWREKARMRKTKYVPASDVWRRWIDQGGYVDQLIAPIIHNTLADFAAVDARSKDMSDPKRVDRQIMETDRKDIGRRRGPDIHSDARGQLHALLKEPCQLASQWLSLVSLLNTDQDNALRQRLQHIHALLRESRTAVMAELNVDARDRWGRIPAARHLARRAFDELLALFENPQSVLDTEFKEPEPAQVLGRACLSIAALPLADNWQVELSPERALACLANACDAPQTAEQAYQARLRRGDLWGAQWMLDSGLVEAESADMPLPEHVRGRWKAGVQTQILEARVAVDNGLYNGYVPDEEHRRIEAQLTRLETNLGEQQRFDRVIDTISTINAQVEHWRQARIQEVRHTLQAICADGDEARGHVQRAQQALDMGNLAAAYEIAHWLQEGGEFPDILDEQIPDDGFERFFPATMQSVSEWLGNTRRDVVEKVLQTGAFPASFGVDRSAQDATGQRQVAAMWEAWIEMRSRRRASTEQLRTLLGGLGLPLRDEGLHRFGSVTGADRFSLWDVGTRAIEDQDVCALPIYGSRASGVYRLLCAWGGSEQELMQWVGDAADDTATLLLYFDRLPEHRWRRLAQMAHKQRRAFVVLDETLLLYLCALPGSRLRAWFNIAMPFAYSSPYDASAGSVPPEMFYGRSEELEAVCSRNGRCFVYGGRQLGKTALLKRAAQSFDAPAMGRLARWIDLRAEGIGVRRPAADIWQILHKWLKDSGLFSVEPDAPKRGRKPQVDHEQDVLQGINAFLSAGNGQRVLLLLDEADRFFERDSLEDFAQTRILKQLMDTSERRFKVVFAGLHNVLRMTEYPNHPLAHFGEPIEIGPLHKDKEITDAVALVRHPMAAAGFQFDSIMLVVRILAQTNYYPSLIQLYCSHLIKHMLGRMKTQSLTGPRYLITDDDLRKVYSSDALRNEIRAKFRLTLQLDPRYEVLAYALALAMLNGEYSDQHGIVWQDIRRLAHRWWADGFQGTSEKDFEVLLQEMEGLGVLRRVSEGGYVLRNPNVQLLLGTREEIEAVLETERIPAAEFDSISFHPPLRAAPDGTGQCNIFTYQQLGELVRFKRHSITLLAGTAAAGLERVAPHLADYLADGQQALVTVPICTDRASFDNALKAVFERRSQPLLVLIPQQMPWSWQWVDDAWTRLKRLGPDNPVSLLFTAEPATLWRWLKDESGHSSAPLPWMSLQHWHEGFVHHWLEDRHFGQEVRKRLICVTGLWPERIIELAGECHTDKELTERLNLDERDWPTLEQALDWLEKLGLHLTQADEQPDRVLRLLAEADTMSMQELQEWAQAEWADELSMAPDEVNDYIARSLKWGELLGLVRREGEHLWALDEMAGKVLKALMRKGE